MKKIYQATSLIFFLAFILISSCKKDKIQQPEVDSFLPMQIGNLWWVSDQSYTEIQDTVRINNKLFYKFYSLIGGDATSTAYLRIDEQNRLIESAPGSPLKIYIRAEFSAEIGDKFFTSGDKDYNDKEVTVVQKTNTEMSFSFDPIFHPNLKGHPSQIKYIKGKGWADNWKKLKINGRFL